MISYTILYTISYTICCARATHPPPSPWVAMKNCPAAPRLVLWSSLTDPEAVCTLGWSGDNACGPQPQPFFRVLEHHKDSVSDTVLLVARLKTKLLLSERHHSFACAVGPAWAGDQVPLNQLKLPPPAWEYVRHCTSDMLHSTCIRCRIRYEHTISYVMYI